MHKYTLLIADASEEFCESMRLEACDQYHVHCCSSGSDAQNLLRTLCPDVLILDLMLPFVDGITLLQQAQQEGIRPITLVTTALVNDYVNRRLEELEVSFLIRKPCNVHAVMQHLLELTHIPAPFQTVSDHSAAMLRVLLLPLCVNPKRKGYTSLLDAILMVKDDPDASFTKEILMQRDEINSRPWGYTVEESVLTE